MHAPAVLVADYAQTVDFANTSAVLARATLQSGAGGGAPTDNGIDILERPTAHLSISDRRLAFDVRDSLALTVPDLELGLGCSECATQLFDYADASLAWRARRVRLGVREEASGGLYNSANLLAAPPAPAPGTMQPPTPPMPVQLSPAPATITTASTRTTASAGVQLDRLASTGVSVSYYAGGGLTAESQALLPFQRSVRADAYLEETLGRRDRMSTLGYVQDTEFSPGPCLAILGATATTMTGAAECAPRDELAQLTESWRHNLDRVTFLTLSAGLTAVRVTGVGPTESSFWCDASSECLFPNADLGVSTRFGTRGNSEIIFDASMIPLVDIRTGFVSERVQLVASLAERVARSLAIRADITGAQTVPPSDPLAASTVMGGVAVDYRTSRLVTLTMAERALWQEQAGFGTFFSSITSLSLTVSSPVLRL